MLCLFELNALKSEWTSIYSNQTCKSKLHHSLLHLKLQLLMVKNLLILIREIITRRPYWAVRITILKHRQWKVHLKKQALHRHYRPLLPFWRIMRNSLTFQVPSSSNSIVLLGNATARITDRDDRWRHIRRTIDPS